MRQRRRHRGARRDRCGRDRRSTRGGGARRGAGAVAVDPLGARRRGGAADGAAARPLRSRLLRRGVLARLHDLDVWARGLADALRPHGELLLFEDHPVADCVDGLLHWREDYFVDPAADTERLWRLGQVVTALAAPGSASRRSRSTRADLAPAARPPCALDVPAVRAPRGLAARPIARPSVARAIVPAIAGFSWRRRSEYPYHAPRTARTRAAGARPRRARPRGSRARRAASGTRSPPARAPLADARERFADQPLVVRRDADVRALVEQRVEQRT